MCGFWRRKSFLYYNFALDVPFTVPPTVSMPQPRVTGVSGARVELKCQVTGTPAPQIHWSKQGGSLPNQHLIDGDTLV